MKILANPVFLRAAVVFFCATFSFLLALMLMRKLRKSIDEESDLSEGSPSLDTLPMHVYNTVIQQLKSQKQELQVQSQAEQSRARISDALSQAVLTNLPCGVLIFGPNGLVKTSNPAAKAILGFASMTGMGAEDIFRGALVRPSRSEQTERVSDDDDFIRLADEVETVLRKGGEQRHVEAEYETPAGEERFFAVTVSPVPAGDGSLLGVLCMVNDVTELERLRRQQESTNLVSPEQGATAAAGSGI